MGAEFFHADRQTDKDDESSSRFSQFCGEQDDGETWIGHLKELGVGVNDIKNTHKHQV